MIVRISSTTAKRLCERCPYPSRAATKVVTIASGTYRVKHTRVYLCDVCAANETSIK